MGAFEVQFGSHSQFVVISSFFSGWISVSFRYDVGEKQYNHQKSENLLLQFDLGSVDFSIY